MLWSLFQFASDDPQELVEMMQKILQEDEITKIQVLGKGKRKRIEMIFSESEDSDLGKEQVSFCLLCAGNWYAHNVMKQTKILILHSIIQ